LQEELAALNLAKYRKAQHDLEEAEERLAESNELNARNRMKSRLSATPTTASNKTVRMFVLRRCIDSPSC
jgi:hypothetical protein